MEIQLSCDEIHKKPYILIECSPAFSVLMLSNRPEIISTSLLTQLGLFSAAAKNQIEAFSTIKAQLWEDEGSTRYLQ